MDTFGITILIIIVTTLAASYIKRVTKDKCLRSFEGFIVTLELADGSRQCGKLEVENTGIEVIYVEQRTEGDIIRMSHIIYKDEYAGLNAVLRYHEELTEKSRKKRAEALEKTYHPNILRRIRRKIINFFKLIKDSLMEVAAMISGKLKTAGPAAGVIAGNEKYTGRVNQELVNTIDASYDPLLEKYIGNVVAIDLKKTEGITRLAGILKEYTQNYIELLDVRYTDGRMCDTVFPRRLCSVRGLGESGKHYSIFTTDFEISKYKRFFKRINIKKRNDTDG